jgi:hypothetical protein
MQDFLAIHGGDTNPNNFLVGRDHRQQQAPPEQPEPQGTS